MTKFKKKFITAIATGALLLNTLTPFAFAATTLQITGNGAASDNTATVVSTNTNTVVQNNEANISNNVTVKADTGDNDANNNTGGDVTVDTGDAKASAEVSNAANLNIADVANCGTCQGDSNVEISGNGSESKNEVQLETTSETEVFQDNEANIDNNVYVKADTGDNDANNNTGGDVLVRTGDAKASAEVSTSANANIASVGADNNGDNTVSAKIIGNGSDSKNTIDLGLNHSAVVVQNNEANINNDVYVKADTGDNDANNNTGGDVTIDTGDAKASADVESMVNFNSAQVDCCVLGVDAKIAGNGTGSENLIEAELENVLEIFQGDHKAGNLADIWNDVYVKADTGDNDAENNTADVSGGDPSVMTGDAEAEQSIMNKANVNLFGSGEDSDLSDLLGDLDLDFHFDLGSLMSFLHSMA